MLQIDRLRGLYRLPRQHPDPAYLRARLDRALGELAPQVLSRALAPLLRFDPEGIWLIRRLDARLVLDAALDEAAMGEALGRELAQAIARRVRQPADGEEALYFPNYAAYAAHFWGDLLEGRAWERWYYGPFEGLRSLSLSQALTEAVLRQPAQTGRVLSLLAESGLLKQALPALSDWDAGRLWAALAPATEMDPPPALLAAFLPHLAPAYRMALAGPSARVRLLLWAGWRSNSPTIGVETAAGACATVEAWAAWLEALAAQPEAAGFPLRLLAGELPHGIAADQAALGSSRGRLRSWLAPLAGQDDLLAAAARVVGRPDALPPQAGTTWTELFANAGYALLLSPLLDLGLPDLLSRLAPTPAVGGVWRFWLALKCLGVPRSEAARSDPALAALLGLPAPPTHQEWQVAAEAAPFSVMATLRRGYLQILVSQGRSDGRCLAVEEVAGPSGQNLRLLRDMRSDYWLSLEMGELPGALPLDELAAVYGAPPEWVWTLGDPFQGPAPAGCEAFLQRSHPAEPEVAYFDLPGLPPPANLVFTLLAQGVLRTFARRLLGFAWSSPAFLYANFLEGSGGLRRTAQGLEVDLPLPPLHAVLELSGGREASLESLPWSGEAACLWLGGRGRDD